MHETIEALSAYVDNEVSAAERARIESHLASCVDCASRKVLLERASASLRTLPTPSPTAAESRRIREGVLRRTRRRSLRARLRPVWAGAGALGLVVAGVAALSSLVRNNTRSDTTAARQAPSVSETAPVFDNLGALRTFVSTDPSIKRALAVVSVPAASSAGSGAEATKSITQAPDAKQYELRSAPRAPAPPVAGSASASPPPRAADSGRTDLGVASERSATDCLTERQHGLPNVRPVHAGPATYTGNPAWLLVYAAPPPSPGAHEQLAVYLVRRADCGVLVSQVVDAP